MGACDWPRRSNCTDPFSPRSTSAESTTVGASSAKSNTVGASYGRLRCARKPAVRLGAALIVALATLVLPWAPSAHAETSTDVQKQVNVLLDRIRDLQKQAAFLAQAYDKSLDQARASVSGDAEADRAVDGLSLTARVSQARLSGRVRGIYMAGGPLAVYSTLMSSGSLVDLADRTAMAQRVLQANMFRASQGQVRADQASAQAKVTSKAVIERIRVAQTLAELSRRLHETLSEQQDVMKLLRARLAKVKAHEAEVAQQAELARQAKAREAAILKMQADSEKAMQMSIQQAMSAVQTRLNQQQSATDTLGAATTATVGDGHLGAATTATVGDGRLDLPAPHHPIRH